MVRAFNHVEQLKLSFLIVPFCESSMVHMLKVLQPLDVTNRKSTTVKDDVGDDIDTFILENLLSLG